MKFCRIEMKRFFYVPCLLMVAGMLLSSCLKNEETEVTLYNDAAITSFTLGTLVQTNPQTGTKTNLTGSVYKMAIDQINFRIYNRDSLPVGTAIDSVFVTIATKNNGGVVIRTLNDTTLYDWYSSSVAIDFSNPRLFRVFATDGSYYRDYEVKLNVKKSSTTDFWTAQADTTLFGNFEKVRMLSLDTMLVALGSTSTATQVCLSLDKGKTWTLESQEFDAAACQNAVVSGDSIFVLSNNQLFISKNAKEWESKANSWGLSQLVGADTKELFALTADHELKAARTDDLDTWNTEQTDLSLTDSVAGSLLTLQDIACVSFPYTALPSADYVLLVGNDGTNTVVWRKISQYDNTGNTGRWVNIPAETVNHYLLPKQSPLSLVYKDSKVWAMGTNTSVYQSTDQGISWRINTNYTLPIAMLSTTIDDEGVLWGISVNEGIGKIWRGLSY